MGNLGPWVLGGAGCPWGCFHVPPLYLQAQDPQFLQPSDDGIAQPLATLGLFQSFPHTLIGGFCTRTKAHTFCILLHFLSPSFSMPCHQPSELNTRYQINLDVQGRTACTSHLDPNLKDLHNLTSKHQLLRQLNNYFHILSLERAVKSILFKSSFPLVILLA